MLALLVPAVGMGGWAWPTAVEPTRVAELGMHDGPTPHGDPAERIPELPLTSEPMDGKDAAEAEDELRDAVAVLVLDEVLDLGLTAAIARHRFLGHHDDRSTASHGGGLPNRGPPLA